MSNGIYYYNEDFYKNDANIRKIDQKVLDNFEILKYLDFIIGFFIGTSNRLSN